jgi:nucleoside-triphosphatase THEP1
MDLNNNHHLSGTWQKAAVLGSLWASSEIVLGSFLHNLRIPFSGIFLTSIGIILLVSVSYQWRERGLIWRAGLICAIMKAVSPSAVIFGPMIAIFLEAILLESSVRIFGKNMIGFFIGSILAISWSFFQKIANFIIIYGFNIVDLYSKLINFAEKQFQFHFTTVWMPVMVLWTLYIFFGALSALVGIYIGKTVVKAPPPIMSIDKKRTGGIKSGKSLPAFKYSPGWLILTIVGMISLLVLMNFTKIIWWGPAGIALLSAWVIRYKNILKPLRKPGFWIFFVLITMLSSFLFAKIQASQISNFDGFIIGLQMNFRAAIMIIGFSVAGKELSNPVIRSFFTGTSFKQLPLSIEVAFNTLPFVIANMPSYKDVFKKPIPVLRQLTSQAEFWLGIVELSLKKKSNVIIVTGDKGDGKSTLLAELAVLFEREGIQAGGIISPAVIENGEKSGYELINVATAQKIRLSQTKKGDGMVNVGRFYFFEDGIAFGKTALKVANNQMSKIIFIDEVGAWELQGQGWAESLNELTLHCDMPIILAVNVKLVDQVVDCWQLQKPLIINAKNTSSEEAFGEIIQFTGLDRVNLIPTR